MTYLEGKKKLVDNELECCLHSEPQTSNIVTAMRYSLLAGGKRIRPILAIAAYEMFASPTRRTPRDKGHNLSTVLPTALAVEMIHTMSLIHDDLPSMDNDDVRRGKPANHKVYGNGMAILAGDALLAYAFEYVARRTPVGNSEAVLNVIRVLAESAGPNGLAGGQAKDLQSEGNQDVELETLIWIHMHKAATLIRASCVCGAVLGGAKEEDISRVGSFADKIGLAGQIIDDVLDITQSSKMLGKTAGKDEMHNKITYPGLMGIEESTTEAQRLVNDARNVLMPYGERANKLLAIADFVISREH